MLQVRKGGQGKKLPYTTVVKRVPTPLSEDIDRLTEDYCRKTMGDEGFSSTIIVSRSQLVEDVQKILKWKKGTKQSMIGLIEILFGTGSAYELKERQKK